MAMDQQNEPASIKYTKKIIELIEQEISEVNENIESAEYRLNKLHDRKVLLYDGRRVLYKELRKAESELCCDPRPNVPLIFADGKPLDL